MSWPVWYPLVNASFINKLFLQEVVSELCKRQNNYKNQRILVYLCWTWEKRYEKIPNSNVNWKMLHSLKLYWKVINQLNKFEKCRIYFNNLISASFMKIKSMCLTNHWVRTWLTITVIIRNQNMLFIQLWYARL